MLPASCSGMRCAPTAGSCTGGFAMSASAAATSACVALIGSTSSADGTEKSGCAKSKHEVRSPEIARRQAEMFGSCTPVQVSRKRITEVWSNTCESTQPPRLHGDTTVSGTRVP